MNFNTPVHIDKSEIGILPTSKIMTIGSCFSVHMGDKLSAHCFDSLANPFGTVFNPFSIANLITLGSTGQLIESSELDEQNGRYFHYDFHSNYDASSTEQVLNKINKSISIVNETIENLDILIVTFGTSIGYNHKDQQRLVSNCHKVPNTQFDRHFIDEELMFSSMKNAIDLLRNKRPNLHIIFTVSPVRHTKEGLVDNSRSKSNLLRLSHRLTHYLDNSTYFPSYEIMIDELRGYRFYKEDMIHPSDQAIDIIWNRFIDTYFTPSAIDKIHETQKLNQAMKHRPFDPKSEGHQKFLAHQMNYITNLKSKYPEVDFSEYENFFKD